MQTSLVLTVLGDDRPGLVRVLSDVLEQHQGNWAESRMVDLAGKFAGLLEVTVPDDRVADFITALNGLKSTGLNILFEQAGEADQENSEDAGDPERLNLEVLGPDAPGIIHNITEQLATLNVNLQELSSEQRQAPMSGEMLFFASMVLELPEGLTEDDVQDALEGLEDQLMVDLNFS